MRGLNQVMYVFFFIRTIQAVCDPLCANCDASNNCIQCKDITNMTISNNTCQCPTNSYFDNAQQICIFCQAPCATCNVSPIFCESCIESAAYMFLASSTCFCTDSSQPVNGSCGGSCTSPCLTCSGSGCATCVDGTYLSGTTCLNCTPPCSKCSLNATNCTECTDFAHMTLVGGVCNCLNSSYYFNGTICTSCTSPCASCSSTATTCTSCINGTYLSGSTCHSCSVPCANCNSPTSCITCSEPSNMDQTGDVCSCKNGRYWTGSTCATCTSPCSTCVTADTHCTGCAPGKYIVGSTCSDCTAPCATCSTADTTCDTCMDNTNMTLTSHVCTCTNTSNFFNGTICTACTNPCASCSSTATTCTSCINGTYLSGSTCISCSVPCANCNSPTSCITCSEPSNMDQTGDVCSCKNGRYWTGSTCATCTSPCSTCVTADTHCTGCAPGKFLIGSTCSDCTAPCATSFLSFSEGLNSFKVEVVFICVLCFVICQSISISEFFKINIGRSPDVLDTSCDTCMDDLHMTLTSHVCTCTNTSNIFNGTICTSCTSPCASCSSTATTCTSCINGTYLSGSTCHSCSVPCANCNSPTSCITCSEPSNMDQTGDVCSCKNGRYWTGSTCATCTSPCSTCVTADTHCTGCAPGKYLVGSTCSDCTAPCATCSTADTACDTCMDNTNMTLTSHVCTCTNTSNFFNGTICTACTSPCATCEISATHCTSCVDTTYQTINASFECVCPNGRYFDGTDCKLCTAPCATCETSDTHCLTCTDAAHQQINASFKCICTDHAKFFNGAICEPCSRPCNSCVIISINCTSCVDTLQRPSTCACPNTYYLNGSQQCSPCVSPCVNCISPTQCLTCVENQYIHGYDCLKCMEPCYNCEFTNDHCLDCLDLFMEITEDFQCKCKKGYYQVGFSCYMCEAPCFECETYGNQCLNCLSWNQHAENYICKCNDGYFPYQNECSPCTLPCTTCLITSVNCQSCLDPNHLLINEECVCKYGYITNPSNPTVCSECHYPCADCILSTTNCTRCMGLFQLKGGQCLCEDGYYQLNGQCFKCHQKCKTCLNYDQCLECSDLNASLLNQCLCPMNYLTQPGKCMQCDIPCYSCISQTNLCLSCIDMHQYTDNWTCKCEDGYYMINNVCDSCLSNCKICENKIECLTCLDTYYINANKTCSKCKYPCANCLSDTSCLSCQIRFRLVEDYCVPCPDVCLSCLDDGLCNECIDGYYVSDQNCYECSSNCKTCSINSINCTSCNDENEIVNSQGICECKNRYFYQNGRCLQCQELCEQCDEYDKCLECYSISKIQLLDNKCSCESGYYYNGNECLICDAVCLECANSSSNCTKCADNRQLKNKTCICAKDYYSDNLNRCEPCNTEVGRLVKECNYANCTDNIWTWGEECDDGNTTPRDGCTNCKLDESSLCWGAIGESQQCKQCPLNCRSCQLTDDEKNSLSCQQCLDGYFLNNENGQCFACNEICEKCTESSKNCLSCKYISLNDKCSLCEDKTGYITDLTNNACISRCGDGIQTDLEQCDDGNNINGDGCSAYCTIESGFQCNQDICSEKKYLIASLYAESSQPYNNVREFTLTFDNLLQFGKIKDFLKIKLNQNSSYEQTITESATLEQEDYYNIIIFIVLSFNESCQNGVLTVEINKVLYSKENETLENNFVETSFDDYYYINQGTVQATEQSVQTNFSLLIFLAVLAGIGLLFGGLDVFYNLLDTLQLVSYLQYINTLFPYNLQEFLNLFSFVQIRFLENFINFESLIADQVPTDYLNSCPTKILEDDITPLFYLNGASILSVWITFILIYQISFLIPLLLNKINLNLSISDNQNRFLYQIKLFIVFAKIYILKINNSIQNQFIYSGIIRTHISTAYDFSFAIFTNLYSLNLYSSNVFIKISSYTTLIALLLYLIIAYITSNFCQQNTSYKSKYIEDKYGAAFEGIQRNGYSKFYTPFCLIKKFLFMASLIICYQFPIFQTINILLLSIINIIILLQFRPLVDINEYRKQLICEICISLTVYQLLLLVLMNQYHLISVNSEIIGWCCITSISIILILQVLIDAKQQWTFLYKKYKIVRNLVDKILQKQNLEQQ